MAERQDGAFKGRHFTSEIIQWAQRRYLTFRVSYRDLSLMLSDRGVVGDRTTICRRVRAYAASLEKRRRSHLRRNATSARRFCCKALAQVHTDNPRTITVDKNLAYPRATTDMKRGRELWRFARLRQCKYPNNIVSRIIAD